MVEVIMNRKIISASRRTDLPAFHSEWFLDGVNKGYVDVVNPYSKENQIISLLPENVNFIAF